MLRQRPSCWAQGRDVPVMALGGILPEKGDPLSGDRSQLRHRSATLDSQPLPPLLLNGYQRILCNEPLYNL